MATQTPTQSAERRTRNLRQRSRRALPDRCAFRVSRSAFTLTEVLVVVGLIVLLILLAVPAFNLISGSRSIAGAENVVASFLGRARAEALRSGDTVGVAFFRDPKTGRTAMAMVVDPANQDLALFGAESLNQYKAWTPLLEDGRTPTPYAVGQTVASLVPHADDVKQFTRKFICVQAHNASMANAPRVNASGDDVDPAVAAYWALDKGADTGFTAEVWNFADVQYLAAGVGAQLVNDSLQPGASVPTDRYVRTGVIMFDGQGALGFREMSFGTDLWRLIKADQQSGTPVKQTWWRTQIGVVLYDDPAFRAAGGTDGDPMYGADVTIGGNDAPAEEPWLAENGLTLMVNRYNGTLVGSEE